MIDGVKTRMHYRDMYTVKTRQHMKKVKSFRGNEIKKKK